MKTKYIVITAILILMLGLLTSVSENEPTIETPVPSEMIIEDHVPVEHWMTEPFIAIEEPLEVEDWMTKPFVTTKNYV
jgi:hypothetical protein